MNPHPLSIIAVCILRLMAANFQITSSELKALNDQVNKSTVGLPANQVKDTRLEEAFNSLAKLLCRAIALLRERTREFNTDLDALRYLLAPPLKSLFAPDVNMSTEDTASLARLQSYVLDYFSPQGDGPDGQRDRQIDVAELCASLRQAWTRAIEHRSTP
jgi:hypothetical protein